MESFDSWGIKRWLSEGFEDAGTEEGFPSFTHHWDFCSGVVQGVLSGLTVFSDEV